VRQRSTTLGRNGGRPQEPPHQLMLLVWGATARVGVVTRTFARFPEREAWYCALSFAAGFAIKLAVGW
jgi:hypothetical protein